MPYLLDTNCWMQIVRKREHYTFVAELLRVVPRSQIFITDFGLHSLLIAMKRYGQLEDFSTFAAAVGLTNDSMVVEIPTARLSDVVVAVSSHRLDVDDGYHYAAAEIYGLDLVSLDADFDHTPRGRLTPERALQKFKDEH